MEMFSEVLGEKINIPDDPKRIVSLAPAITDTLYALGLEDRIVGVSVFCDKPEKAKLKPKVGSYFKVNYKLLEELKPDLVLVTTGAQRDRLFELREKGYTVVPVPLPVNLFDIISNTLLIGIVTNKHDDARLLAMKMLARIYDMAEENTIGSVYYEVDLGGPTSAGGITYIDHALRTIGLSNIFGHIRTTWIIDPDPSIILEQDPDYVIYEPKPYSRYSEDYIRKNLEKRGLSGLRALEKGNLIILEPNSLAHYGLSLLDTLEAIKYRIKST